MKVLVTGGAGFIGSNFVRYLLHSREDVEILNLDKLTYAGNLESLAEFATDPRYSFVRGDIADPKAISKLLSASFDAVINFAAETHVDSSIEDASPFLRTNVLGTQCLLEAAKNFRIPRFLHISTDEVYGSAPPGIAFTESADLNPRNPYAASKASADHFVAAYANTYRLPTVILRCTNNYGPFQFPEKFIPLVIANALEGKPLPIYGDGMQERDWLFVEDFCRAIALALEKAAPGSLYNVSAGCPQPNLKTARAILDHLGKPQSLITHVQDRMGHDRRYALDSWKFRDELGWAAGVSFEEGIRKTVDWYVHNASWLEHARSGEYRDFYERHYIRRAETFPT